MKFLEAIEHNWPGPWTVVPDCGEDDGGFSWTACDSCGSNLGGDRQPATAINHETKETVEELGVCVDCCLFHANGDLPEDSEEDRW